MLIPLFKKYNIILILLMFSASICKAQDTRLTLSMRADQDVQNIFNTLATELLKETQWGDDSTQVIMSSDSAMDKGEINGQFVLNSTPAMATHGKVETILTTSGTQAQISSHINIITTSQFFFGVATKSTGTSVTSLAQFKTQILKMVTSLSSSESRQTMTFDGSSSGSGLDQKQIQNFIAALESNVQVSSVDTEEVMTIDMAQIKSSWEPLADSLPQLKWLTAINNMEVRRSGTEMSVSILTTSNLPSAIISNYDSYVSSKQNTGGLSSLNNLIQSIGAWVIRHCSTDDYRQECINKILYDCSSSTKSIASCVSQAENVRGLVAAKNDGNIFSMIRYGTTALVQEGINSIGSDDGPSVDWNVEGE